MPGFAPLPLLVLLVLGVGHTLDHSAFDGVEAQSARTRKREGKTVDAVGADGMPDQCAVTSPDDTSLLSRSVSFAGG